TELNGHTPAGPLRGGKYSIFEAGTRVPFLVKGPGVAKNNISDALLCQIDVLASVAQLLGLKVPPEAMDSEALSQTLLGRDKQGRPHLVEHAGTLAVVKGQWK